MSTSKTVTGASPVKRTGPTDPPVDWDKLFARVDTAWPMPGENCSVCGTSEGEPHKSVMGKPYRGIGGFLVADELHATRARKWLEEDGTEESWS